MSITWMVNRSELKDGQYVFDIPIVACSTGLQTLTVSQQLQILKLNGYLENCKVRKLDAMYNAALFAASIHHACRKRSRITSMLITTTISQIRWAKPETQRRIQFGVAKKIKNEARKIVLEKAEEARDAAFSAFKALGVTTKKVKPFIPPSIPQRRWVKRGKSLYSLDQCNILFKLLIT
ncbi:hypothetical protein Tco_0615523 [Tanacetum coccineum]